MTRRNGSSGVHHPGMFRLVQAVDGYDFRFEIDDSTQNELGEDRVSALL